MSEAKTMIQTEVTFDGTSFRLAQEQDVAEIRSRIEAAIRTAGAFVVGNREVSVLVTPRSHVTISVATVAFDSRDTGDLDYPFGGYFDEL